jgi:CHAT domain-containing protein
MLVSQWKVSSASTSQLMANFYKSRKGKGNHVHMAEVARISVLNLILDLRYRHPFYWAGFVLIGRNVSER